MMTYRFDPVDLEQMRLLGRLSPGGRIQVMLDARELAVGLIRGRLRRQYPDLSSCITHHASRITHYALLYYKRARVSHAT